MDASLNQPSSVQEDGPLGCKLLLVGNKVQLVSCFVCTIRKRTGYFRASSRGNTVGPGVIRIYWV